MTSDEIMRTIDSATEPSKMSAQEALDFLEGLADDIDARIEGLKSDLA